MTWKTLLLLGSQEDYIEVISDMVDNGEKNVS